MAKVKTFKTIFDKLRYVVSESRTHDDSVYYIPAISSSSAEWLIIEIKQK